MKKAQSMPMNVIIVAALALIVLIILAVVFMNKMGGFVKETDTCTNNGGSCVVEKDGCGQYQVEKTGDVNYKCEKGKICCVGISTGE